MPKFFFGISKTDNFPFRKGQTVFFTKDDDKFILIASEKAWIRVDKDKIGELIIPTLDEKENKKFKFLPNANRAANRLFNVIFRRKHAEKEGAERSGREGKTEAKEGEKL